MLFKIIIYIILISLAAAEKSLTIVLDTSGSMAEEIRIMQEKIPVVLRKITNRSINNYILVTYGDPDIPNVSTSLTQDGLIEYIKSVEVKREGLSCPDVTVQAIESALEMSKPESYIYVFTDAPAKDYQRFDNVQRLCRRRQSQVFIFTSGKCYDSDTNEAGEQVYFNIAKSCNGSYISSDIRSFHQGFLFMKETSNVDWTETGAPNAFVDRIKYSFTIDTYTENLIAAVSCESPTFEILNNLENRPSLQTIMATKHALIVSVMPEIGDYSMDINCQGTGTATFYRRKTIKFKYGFSPLQAAHLVETSTRPLPHIKTNILIVLPMNINVEMVSIRLQSDQESKDLGFRVMDENKLQFTAVNEFNPEYSYKILIICKDKTTGDFVTGQSDTIKPQQSASPEKVVVPFSEKTLLEPPLILYGTNFRFSCKVIGYPEPEIWWEKENGDKIPSEHALLETPFVYISYATIENAAVNSTVLCKSKNLGGENTMSIDYYINRPYSFDVVRTPIDTTIEYDKEGKLYCEVSAYPEAEIKWRHNDTDVVESENVQVISDEHMLRINRMSLDDTGEYSCEAANEVESRTFAASVYVTGLETPQVDIGIMEIILHPNDMKELTCNVIKGTPIPELKWKYKSNLGAESGDLPEGVSTSANSIEIASVTVSHAGIYVCEATNILGVDAAEIVVKVQYAPKIKNDDEIRTVKSTHQVELSCDVDAEPPADVRWYMSQDDVIMEFDDRHTTDSDHRHHFIANAKDSGVYHCVAENSVGSAVRTVTINVLVKPYIEPVRPRIRLRTGDSITLPCNILEGNPLPTTRVEFTDLNKITTVLISGNSTGKLDLPLQNITKRNEGTYQCVAENTAGVDTVAVILKVD